MDVLIQVLQFLLSLSILIVLHELGHFIPAKLFKTRVEKFYLFFDPWFSLFKFKKGETEYGIGWLPLGGYVKISGMVDESMDKEQMKLPPQPWEFRSKPAWQRLIIMIGGVTVNVILGILIYAMIFNVWGKEYLPTENVKYGIAVDSVGYKIGLRNGDKILSVDNRNVASFNRLPLEIILEKAKTIQVERDGKKLDVPVAEDDLSRIIKAKKSFITPRLLAIVDTVIPNTPAEKAGLRKNDRLIGIDTVSITYFNDFIGVISKMKSKDIQLKVLRNNDTLVLPAKTTEQGTLGFAIKIDQFEIRKEEYTLLEAFPAGIKEGYETILMQIKQFSVIFTVKDAHQSVGGFWTMIKVQDTDWNWRQFWHFTALISIALAFMNILPIPALDGGHVMFLLYEVITGRKPNEKFLEYAQYVGMFLLLALLLYANGNDIFRHR
jgi:regulator of sigma E protease